MDARPTITIDGVTYKLELWQTSKCFEWQERLTDLGLETIAMALSQRELPWRNLGDADFPFIAKTLLEKVKGARLAGFIKELLGNVFRVEQRSKGDVDVPIAEDYEFRYRGKTMHLYKLAGWVIAQNLADFMVAARWLGEVLQSKFSIASREEQSSNEAAEGEADQLASSAPTAA